MTKCVILLVLALTAIQGLNADTLLKRNSIGNIVSNAKSHWEHAQDAFKNFSAIAQEHIKADEQKVAERINATKDFFKGLQQKLSNILHRNSTTQKRSPFFFDHSPKRSISVNLFNKSKEYAEQVKEKLDKAAGEIKEKFEEFLNKIKERLGQNTTTSKRSISFDTGLTIINDLRSKLDAAVQNVKQYLSNNADSSILDNLKNIASGIVSTKFNLTEISADVSECVQAEESNVTNAVQRARSQLEAIISKEEQAAEPFLQNVSVTAPKVANLIFEASFNASSCGQNYICVAIVAFNAYNEAVVLEPEVAQEIQAAVALAKSLAADAKVISEQILAPAFSGVVAISQETISCVEGKLNA